MNDDLLRNQRMPVFNIPENIRVEFVLSLSTGLQSLLEKLVDQRDDRAAAAKLAGEVKQDAAALADALPKPQPNELGDSK